MFKSLFPSPIDKQIITNMANITQFLNGIEAARETMADLFNQPLNKQIKNTFLPQKAIAEKTAHINNALTLIERLIPGLKNEKEKFEIFQKVASFISDLQTRIESAREASKQYRRDHPTHEEELVKLQTDNITLYKRIIKDCYHFSHKLITAFSDTNHKKEATDTLGIMLKFGMKSPVKPSYAIGDSSSEEENLSDDEARNELEELAASKKKEEAELSKEFDELEVSDRAASSIKLDSSNKQSLTKEAKTYPLLANPKAEYTVTTYRDDLNDPQHFDISLQGEALKGSATDTIKNLMEVMHTAFLTGKFDECISLKGTDRSITHTLLAIYTLNPAYSGDIYILGKKVAPENPYLLKAKTEARESKNSELTQYKTHLEKTITDENWAPPSGSGPSM